MFLRYSDVVWNKQGIDTNHHERYSKLIIQVCPIITNKVFTCKINKYCRIDGTKFTIIAQDKNQVEISFMRTWTSSMQGKSVPINIDQR